MTTITALLDAYRHDGPSPVRYRPATWQSSLESIGVPEEVLSVLVDDNLSRPASSAAHAGDRVVDRTDLQRLIVQSNFDDDADVLRAFLLVQAWGTGTSGSRTIRHTTRAFEASETLLANLRRSATTLRAAATPADLAVAYAEWNAPGVGRSFFTKWFANAGRRDGRSWQPLIMDQRVLATLNRPLGITTAHLAGTKRWPERYRAYVEQVHQWSRDDGQHATPEWIEWVLFRHNGGAATRARPR